MTTTYCAASDVNFVLSSYGVARRTDDNEDTIADSTLTTSAIESEAAEMNLYLCRRYVLSALSANAWAKWTNAWLAAYRLDSRLGNNPSPILVKEREERLAILKRIGDGQLNLPEQNPPYDDLPSVTNLESELRGGRQKIRVTPENSTRPPQTDVERFTTHTLYPQ